MGVECGWFVFWVSLKATMNNIFVQDTVSRIPNFESKMCPIFPKNQNLPGSGWIVFLGKSEGHHE